MDQPLVMSIFNGIQQLLINPCNLSKIREAPPQIAGQRSSLNKRHNKIENSIGIAEFDQWQDMRVMKSSHSARFTGKTATHVAIGRIITEYNLDRHTPPEGRALLAFIDSTHATHSNTSKIG